MLQSVKTSSKYDEWIDML